MAENRELALVLKLVADQFQSELKKSGGMLGDFNKFISDWKTQLVAAGGALFAIAKSTANYGEELLKTSQKVGINIEALAGLQHAADLSNLSHEQLSIGLKFLSQNMVEASRRTGDGEALFFRLGVSAMDATGKLRPTEQVLLDLADKFSQAKDGAGKTEAAVKLFGKAGIELIPFLNEGKAGISNLMVEAERLGLVMSKEDAEAASRFNDELKKLQGTVRGFVLDAGKPMLEVFTELGEALRSLTTSTAGQFFFRGLAEQAILFSTIVKEAAANVQFLFGKLSFEDLKTEIKRLEAEASSKLLLRENPQAAQFLTPKAGAHAATDGKPELAQLADQAKLGKALVEIFQEQQRAIEIRNKLAAEDVGGEAFRHLEEFKIQEVKNEEARQAHLGQMIVEQTALEVQVRDEARHDEQQGLIDNAQAWVAYYDQLGGNTQDFLAHKTELLRAQLAKELDFTKQQSAQLLEAWQQRDGARAEQILAASPKSAAQKEAVELNTLRQNVLNSQAASDDFFAGWTDGMRKYVKDTQSGFGLAADMARRTAQVMESSFKSFFFDAMDEKITSFKDALRSLLDFAKQIVSQISSQLVTNQILRALTGVGGSLSGSLALSTHGPVGSVAPAGATGGQLVRRFAMGGPVPGFGNQDTVPALLTPGEFVFSRKDVSDVKNGLAGGVQVVINNYSNTQVEAQSGGRGQDGKQFLYVTIRDAAKKAFSEGAMDKVMAQRFRMIPQAGG